MTSHDQQTGIPTQTGASHFVIVTLGQRLFAIAADAVQGIMDASDLAQSLVPTFQGDVYPTMTIASRLAITGAQEERCGQMVLLMRDQLRGSVRVDCVHGRMALYPAQIVPLPPHFQGVEREWYCGLILFDRSVAVILNLAWVLQGVPAMQPIEDRTNRQTRGATAPNMPGGTC